MGVVVVLVCSSFNMGRFYCCAPFQIRAFFRKYGSLLHKFRSLFLHKSSVFQPTPCKTRKHENLYIYIYIYILKYINIHVHLHISIVLRCPFVKQSHATLLHIYICKYIHIHIYKSICMYVCTYNIIAMGRVYSFFNPPHITHVHICTRIHTYI